MHTEDIQDAINILADAKNAVKEKLKNVPLLQIGTDNVLTTLINGLVFKTGKTPDNIVPQKITSSGKLTHVMGRKISEDEVTSMAVPNDEDAKKAFREKIARLYETFDQRDTKEIRDELTDLEVRAVAKRADMDVSNSNPERITLKFIEDIKQAVSQKKSLDQLQEKINTGSVIGIQQQLPAAEEEVLAPETSPAGTVIPFIPVVETPTSTEPPVPITSNTGDLFQLPDANEDKSTSSEPLVSQATSSTEPANTTTDTIQPPAQKRTYNRKPGKEETKSATEDQNTEPTGN